MGNEESQDQRVERETEERDSSDTNKMSYRYGNYGITDEIRTDSHGNQWRCVSGGEQPRYECIHSSGMTSDEKSDWKFGNQIDFTK